MVDVADGKTLNFIGNLNPQAAGKIPADRAVKKLHFSVADACAEQVHAQQHQKSGRKLHKNGGGVFRMVKIINQQLHLRAQLRGNDERAYHHHQAHDDAQQKLPADALRAPEELNESSCRDVRCFFLLHFPSPPVCEA